MEILANNTGIGMTPRCGSRATWALLRAAGLVPPVTHVGPQYRHAFHPEKREELGLDKVYRLARNPYTHMRSTYRLYLIHCINAGRQDPLKQSPHPMDYHDWSHSQHTMGCANFVTPDNIQYIDDFCILEDQQSFFDRNFPEYNIKFKWGDWGERYQQDRHTDEKDLKYFQENPWAVEVVKQKYAYEFEVIDFSPFIGEFAKL